MQFLHHAISPSSLTLSIILLSYLNFISVSICEVMCVFMCSLECIIGVKHQIMVPDLTLYMIWSTDFLCREPVRWFITHRSYTRTGHGSSQSVPQLHLWRFTNRSLKRVGSLDRTGISEWFIHQEKPIFLSLLNIRYVFLNVTVWIISCAFWWSDVPWHGYCFLLLPHAHLTFEFNYITVH